MVYPNPGCAVFFLRSEQIRERWPKLQHLPRPEPRRHTKDHDYWKEEFKQWKNLTCDQKMSYFCKKHGMWVTCDEVTPDRRCPLRHYQMQQLLEDFCQEHEGAGEASNPSNSGIQGGGGYPDQDEMTSAMDNLSVSVDESQEDEDILSHAQHGPQHQNQQYYPPPPPWNQGPGHSTGAYTAYDASAEGMGHTYETSQQRQYSYEPYRKLSAEGEYPVSTMRRGYHEVDTKHRQKPGDKSSSKTREPSVKGSKGARREEGWGQGVTEYGPTPTNYTRPSGTAQSPATYQSYRYPPHPSEQHSADLTTHADWYDEYATEVPEDRLSGKNRSQSEKKNRKKRD